MKDIQKCDAYNTDPSFIIGNDGTFSEILSFGWDQGFVFFTVVGLNFVGFWIEISSEFEIIW